MFGSEQFGIGVLLHGTGFGEIVTCSTPPPEGAGAGDGLGLGAGEGAGVGAGAGAGEGAGAGAGDGAGDGVSDGAVGDGAVGEGSTLPQFAVTRALAPRNAVNSQTLGTRVRLITMNSPSKAKSLHTFAVRPRLRQKAHRNGRAAPRESSPNPAGKRQK